MPEWGCAVRKVLPRAITRLNDGSSRYRSVAYQTFRSLIVICNNRLIDVWCFRLLLCQDITNLARLSSLRSVGFKSPIYPPSGVSLLCNYAIHVVYHIGQLTELDSADVSSKAVKDTADVCKLTDIHYFRNSYSVTRNIDIVFCTEMHTNWTRTVFS